MRCDVIIITVLVVVMLVSTEAIPWKNRRKAKAFWRKFLCTKRFNWPWIRDESAYKVDRIAQMRNLIGSCKADVGTCPVGSCSTRPHLQIFNCPDDGYICPETEIRTADCGTYGVREYKHVTQCKCCTDNGINITGTVVDSTTEKPLSYMKIKISNGPRTDTDLEGVFNTTIRSTLQSVVIRVIDRRKEYIEAVKIVDIPEGFRGPVNVKLVMIKKSTPVQIDATVEETLSLSDDPTNQSAGNAFIVIDPNSFTDRNGNQYNGIVSASVTFIDSNKDSETVIPGRFLTPVGESLENLISDGIVSFDFKDINGNNLNVKPIKFNVRENMRLWDLDRNTGLWEPSKVFPNRRKRQVTLTEEFLIKVSNGRWYNIDKIPKAPRCYIKVRIFNEISHEEIIESVTSSFKPEIIAYTAQNRRLRLYAGFTRSPSKTCYEVRCPAVSNTDKALAGFINMTSSETVSIGGFYLPSVYNLKPKPIDQYSDVIRTELQRVQYTIAPNGMDIFLNFISGENGIFFTNREKCESATADQPALHFLKPEPPSYEPDETEICTARIAFKDSWNFYNYTLELDRLPTVIGISVWKKETQSFYHNATTTLELSRVEGEDFVFACMEYRCSQDSKDDSLSETTVYVDIDIPNITYSYNDSLWNGTIVSRNHSVPAFYCYGRCTGPLCHKQLENLNGISIDGSFTAPYITNSGPDFFDSEPNTCKDKLGSESFAYEFRCHSNEENVHERGEGETWQPM
ncbi:cartilage intermediate layer protein 2-like [Mercenaria mercenaria]|uniref:cartilage intermediate layer protein 2-like n=1 Tax=Mercenaria mercenaria TaxID=6596 RepID=UPI00234EE82E|nr:cartilage intermediate layer protein 2-like [Mercenaria mercenaria]